MHRTQASGPRDHRRIGVPDPVMWLSIVGRVIRQRRKGPTNLQTG